MKEPSIGLVQRRNAKKSSGLPNRRPGLVALATCALLFGSSVGGCAWVKLSPEAKGVGLAESEAEVADCKWVGNIRAQTKSSVGIIKRNSDQVADELRSLARNEAVDLGADTIMAEAAPTPEGTQKFRAYRCPVN